MSNRYTRKELKDLKDFAEALLKMKEYSITEQQLEKLYMNLDELSGVHKDMMGDDGCVNLRDLEDAKGKLNETIRELKFLVEDIEGQEAEGKRPVTLLEAVGVSAVISALCPGGCQLKNTFEVAGYKQPDSACPRGADGNYLSCTDCWNRPAEPLEDSAHAR